MQQKDERTWATLAHLGGIIGTFIIASVGNILGALFIWLVKRNESAFVDEQGKEALNFQITVSIVNAALGILTAIRAGVWSFNNMFFYGRGWDFTDWSLVAGSHGIIWAFNIFFSIVAAVRASKGIAYKYPVVWRIVK